MTTKKEVARDLIQLLEEGTNLDPECPLSTYGLLSTPKEDIVAMIKGLNSARPNGVEPPHFQYPQSIRDREFRERALRYLESSGVPIEHPNSASIIIYGAMVEYVKNKEITRL